MFLPRVIILLYTTAINTSVKITDVSFMSLTDIYNNIIFAPFIYNNSFLIEKTTPILNASTQWYSLILAIIYFVIGFSFINSENQNQQVRVQHIRAFNQL